MAMPSIPRRFDLEPETANFVPVSQVNQAAAENDDGAKAQTDGTGAAAEVKWGNEPIERSCDWRFSDEYLLSQPDGASHDPFGRDRK